MHVRREPVAASQCKLVASTIKPFRGYNYPGAEGLLLATNVSRVRGVRRERTHPVDLRQKQLIGRFLANFYLISSFSTPLAWNPAYISVKSKIAKLLLEILR